MTAPVADVGPRRPAAVAAGLVVFHPDGARLLETVGILADEVPHLYLFANAPLAPELRAALSGFAALRFIDAETNLGVGAALNIVALAAILDGFDRLVLFDQDSRVPPGMVARLGVAFDRLAGAAAVAAIGPRLVAPPSGAAKAPRYKARPGGPRVDEADANLPVDFLPTSGTMVDLGALRDTGFFRADYFIDAIDIEWCFRAWARGFSCWLAADVTMEHTVGTGVIALPFGFRMPNQAPFRMYCHLRNTLYGFRLAHVPAGWKVKQGAYMAVQMAAFAAHHRFARRAVVPLLAGVRDGLLGRLGVPPDAPGTAERSAER